MSITGHEETGPVKVGVAVTDLFTGKSGYMYNSDV